MSTLVGKLDIAARGAISASHAELMIDAATAIATMDGALRAISHLDFGVYGVGGTLHVDALEAEFKRAVETARTTLELVDLYHEKAPTT